MRRELTDITVSYLVPTVPAVLLYALFEAQNSAAVDHNGVKLGGPAALYVVLLGLALRYMNQWRERSDPAKKLREVLVGSWDISAQSSESGRAVTSSSSFRTEDGSLCLSGGTFREDGMTIGNWSADHVILDPDHDEVTFLYGLKDTRRNVEWRGLMRLTLDRAEPPSMSGVWEVIGPDYRRGTVMFTKRRGSA